MKKVMKAKDLEELYQKSPEGEWGVAKLTEPVRSVFKARKAKAKVKIEA